MGFRLAAIVIFRPTLLISRCRHFEEIKIIVHTIKHHDPFLFVHLEPIVDNSEDIRVWIIAVRDVKLVSYVAVALIQSSCATRIDPKYQGCR